VNKDFYENIPVGTHLFGRFTLLDVIAASDQCGVFKVLSTWGETKGSVLALKITSLESSTLENTSTNQAEELILKEIHLLSKIKSKKVVQAIDWFKDDLFLAYSMEYMANGSIENVLSFIYQRPVIEALPLLRSVAEGLFDIHHAGIIHRDIKPQNILISDSHQIKIADFGIAERMLGQRKVISEQITGTIDFVSPEYIKDGVYDYRSDIYAWGILSYLAVTGHVPFEDESVVDALSRKASEDPISPHFFRREIPVPLEQAILKAIARNPDDRFQSMDEVLVALQKVEASMRRYNNNGTSPTTLEAA
jgi:serine/threonine protein kinase